VVEVLAAGGYNRGADRGISGCTSETSASYPRNTTGLPFFAYAVFWSIGRSYRPPFVGFAMIPLLGVYVPPHASVPGDEICHDLRGYMNETERPGHLFNTYGSMG